MSEPFEPPFAPVLAEVVDLVEVVRSVQVAVLVSIIGAAL
jgi:hypothetical protein